MSGALSSIGQASSGYRGTKHASEQGAKAVKKGVQAVEALPTPLKYGVYAGLGGLAQRRWRPRLFLGAFTVSPPLGLSREVALLWPKLPLGRLQPAPLWLPSKVSLWAPLYLSSDMSPLRESERWGSWRPSMHRQCSRCGQGSVRQHGEHC
ncbi:hypothetical protein BDZ89DRAFT_1117269 [Hymenopellis radicata]|nr:hypothetical protein BDZ89DRAFT_1117269 [Hymenopellis radicata]